MVNWAGEYPNLTPEERTFYQTKYKRARTRREKQQVLENMRNRILAWSENNQTTTLRQNRTKERTQETRKKATNVAKRTGASVVAAAKKTTRVVVGKMPTPEQILDFGSRVGKQMYDNRRGVEFFVEIILLLLARGTNVPRKLYQGMIGTTRRSLPPLDIRAMNTRERLQRTYSLPSSFIGDIVKFDMLLNSDEITEGVYEQFVLLFMVGIVVRLAVIGNEQARKLVTGALDALVYVIQIPGLTLYRLYAKDLLNSIMAMHVQIFASKIFNVASNMLPRPLNVVTKSAISWFDLSKYVGKVGAQVIWFVFTAILDMRFAPKSVVSVAKKATLMLKHRINATREGTRTIGYNNRTPTSSRNNGENVAESPPRPPRRTATVEGEGVSPFRIKASGNDGKGYMFTMRGWNALSNNNRIPTTSNDPVVKLTHRGQVRYARRSNIVRV